MIDIYVSNHGNTKPIKIKPISYEIEIPVQEDRLDCRTMDLEVSRITPIKQFSIVVAADRGVPFFRGYVETYDIDSSRTKSLSVKGVENLLNCRYAPAYYYPDGDTSFGEILSDTLDDGEEPGLLACANSALPPGVPVTVEDEALNIMKIDGGGLSSRLGDRDVYYISYTGLYKLHTWPETLAELDAWDKCIFRDDTNLYVRIEDGQRDWYNLGGLLVNNAFDTTVRLGTCPDEPIEGSLETSFDEIGDIIVPLAISHDYKVTFRDDFYHTYINIEA